MPPVYARASDNILIGSTVSASGFSVLTGYDLETLLTMDPAQRVRFDGDTGTISFAIGSPGVSAAILCIPMHNLIGGSPSVLHITNDNGLDVAVPIDDLQADGFPPTIVMDLEPLATVGELLFGELNLVITGNATNVVFGGAVALYSKRTFGPLSANADGSFTGGFAETYEPLEQEATNEYGTRYVQEYDWTERGLEWSLIGPNAGIVLARDWFLSNHGHARPSLLWPYPDEPDLGLFRPLFGTWQKSLRVEVINQETCQLTASFSEWPKGQVLA